MADGNVLQRTRTCKNCGGTFSYGVGKGLDRIHCGPHCREVWQRAQAAPGPHWGTCSSAGCENRVRAKGAAKCNRCYTASRKREAGVCTVHKCRRPATRVGHGLCEVHYYRVRRTGTTDERQPSIEQTHSHGYVLKKAAGHPLAGANGWAFEHRLVAYEKYGEAPGDCYWCGVTLTWPTATIDHLDEVKSNNGPDNLVASCSPCNRSRGGMKSFIRRIRPERLPDLIATFAHMRAEH